MSGARWGVLCVAILAGACDVAETCPGTAATCPADALQPASFTCRPSVGACDPTETCTGASALCPADVVDADGDSDGVCDRDDDCPTAADPDQADGDGDGKGDACDPCNNVVPVFASKAKVRLKKLVTPPGDDRLKFKGTIVVPTTPAIDPVTKGARLLLDDAASMPIVDVILPGGPAWKANAAGTSWRYADPNGPRGIVKLRMKASKKTPGLLKFIVIGRNGDFAVTSAQIPVKGTLVVDAPMAITGQCGEAVFPGAPSARCAFNATQSRLRCR